MIPVNEPLLSGSEREYVLDCLDTGWISSAGKYIDAFELAWSSYCQQKYGVAVSNGTTALEAAIVSLDLQPGDEVIMPSFTIISCALAIVEVGAVPVLVDSEPDTWCMNVNQIEEKITSKTKAIMSVHIYGHPVDMDPIIELAKKYHLYIIEDAAEAHGAEYKGRVCGSFGDTSCFSFYANKIISTGEGGMVLTSNDKIAEKLRAERNLCFIPGKRFHHEELGHNYRLTNVQAAIGLAQVENIDKHIAQKRWMAKAYQEQLSEIPVLQLPVEKKWAKNVYWMFGIVLDDALDLDAKYFAKLLRENGVDTRPFFIGMHEQPVFHKMGLYLNEHYPVAERLARKGLYLPSGLTLTQSQVDQVCEVVKETLRNNA